MYTLALRNHPRHPGQTPSGRRWLLASLAFALLLGIWNEAEHMADLDAHQGEESCSICLFAGSPGHGLLSSLPIHLPFRNAMPAPRYESDRVISVRLHGYYPQRGPPVRTRNAATGR